MPLLGYVTPELCPAPPAPAGAFAATAISAAVNFNVGLTVEDTANEVAGVRKGKDAGLRALT